MRFERGRAMALGILAVFGAACLISGVSPAQAIPLTQGAPFSVQEGSVPGASSNLLTANAIEFSFNSQTSQTLAQFPAFTEFGAASIGGFSFVGTTVPSFLGAPAPGGYSMYATYTSTGTTAFLSADEIEDTYTSFHIDLFIDPNQSVFLNGPNIGGLTGDEYRIAFADMVCAPGPTCAQDHVFLPPNVALGDFHALLLFSLDNSNANPNLRGSAYFVDPNPFYLNLDFTGVIATSQFPGCSGNPPVCTDFSSTQQGSGDAFFKPVPEPTSLLLLGAGFLLLAGYGRRRKA